MDLFYETMKNFKGSPFWARTRGYILVSRKRVGPSLYPPEMILVIGRYRYKFVNAKVPNNKKKLLITHRYFLKFL